MVVGCENNLFFLQDGREDGPESVGGEGKVEDIADLVEGLAVKTVKMQHLPVCGLLNEDCFSILVLVAAVDIVIECKLCGWRGFLGLSRLFYGYMLPLLLPLIFQQVEVHLI